MYTIYVLTMFCVLFIAASFACLETATVAVSEHRLVAVATDKFWARCALNLKKELERVLIFSLFGNSLFNAALTTLSTMLVFDAVKNSSSWILTIVTLLVTLVIIIFSEATPKIIASKSPLKVLQIVSIPLYYIFIVSKPIIWLIDRIVYAFTRLLRIGTSDGTSLDDLKAIISDARVPFLDSHRLIMKNSIEFNQLLIKDVIIPLRHVEMININDSYERNVSKLCSSHHSKVVVYADIVDNIIGYINVRDLLGYDITQMTSEKLKALVNSIVFIQDFLPAIKQFTFLQQLGQNIFVVVNEYGNILGIGTVSDIVELVFGDFTTDAPAKKYLIVRKSDTEFIVDGATLIREFNELYNLDIYSEFDALSFNGLVLKYLRMIPSSGVCFRIKNIVFEILQASDFGVERVKLIVL